MSFDSYGLSKEEFKKIFLEKTETLVELFLAMQLRAETKGLKFNLYDNKTLWDFFQEVGYEAEDAARIHQKKNDPEAMKEHLYDSILLPSREEMLEDIKSLHAKVDSLIDIVKQLLESK